MLSAGALSGLLLSAPVQIGFFAAAVSGPKMFFISTTKSAENPPFLA